MGDAEQHGLRICVVGAGAAGLAVLKIIKDSKEYKRGNLVIDSFEERDDIGGTWLPAPAADKDIPPPTPMYDSIITNLPHPIMCYPSFWFPPSTPLFPKAEIVEDYLRAYAKEFDLMRHVHLKCIVVSARWSGTRWIVGVRTASGSKHESEYDKLVIANGHYRVPYFPSIPGLNSWRSAGRITHSAWYRHPFSIGDKVLVIGGGYSGIDIAEEMSTVCKRLIHAAPHSIAESHGNITVYSSRVMRLSNLSETRHNFVVDGDTANPLDATTDRVRSDSRAVYFEDGSVETDIDHILLATGYVLSFPFVKTPDLPINPNPPHFPFSPAESLPEHLHNGGHWLFPLARFLFPLTNDFPPTAVAFVGLPVRVAPFPIFEAQAHAIVHAFADPASLDVSAETQEIYSRIAILRADPNIGDSDNSLAHAWHTFRGREQFDYRDALHDFAGLTGDEWRVPEWTVEAYANMNELRKLWKEIVAAGEADDWVRGVGEGGEEEWVEVMKKLLEMAKKRTRDKAQQEIELEKVV
ncbi:FAD/NAD-binding domain-containing protein [Fomitiporia mediterranea MF3/22]|uniref:FAD/NAD-binding domain-containing protein n=1 Tax=Fomitiporia mediterranea (strain MF3/22) TaxID=694068 RepID=UPI00044089AC|nr:FAD/NAD-binding domain-containing protein [Fomitiporia mediterranea MF3/22]EJC99304.1 FAD/NAD-binding domain-containing protein [Fomitiporia mediterranea MF3/22]